jgi:hypothetical protein
MAVNLTSYVTHLKSSRIMTNEMFPCVVGFQRSGRYLRASGSAMKLAIMLTRALSEPGGSLREGQLTALPERKLYNES